MNSFKNRILKSCLLLVLLAFADNTLYGQTNDTTVDNQTDKLFSGYNSTTPGVAVAVVKDGKVIFKKGYGTANLEYDTPITPKTVFHVASVSKQFTAFSIYLLEKQGKISFEDDIRKYVSEVPDFGKPVKIKHLLSHTSGLRDQWALLTLAGWRMDDVITTEHILKIISRQKELNFEPGSQFSYSNSGFTLLAEVVRRVSGRTFAEYTKENIFVPLGMTDTQFYDDFNKVVKNRAYSYEFENGIYKKKNLNYSTVGATSLFTTVEDLAKWALNFEKPVVGDSELIRRFNEPSLLNDRQPVLFAVIEGENNYHAKGQFTRNYRGVKLFNHTGHDAGFWSYLLRFPDKKLSIITLSNDDNMRIFQTGMTIAGYYLKNDLKEKQNVNTANTTNEKPKSIEKPNTNLKDFEGEFYNEELLTTYSVKAQGGKLVMSHIRVSDIELIESRKDRFSGRIEFPVEIEFLRDKNEAVNGFKISNFGAKNVRFDKAGNPIANKVGAQDKETESAKVPLNNYLQGQITGNPEFIRKAFYKDTRIRTFRDGKLTNLSVEEFVKFFNDKPAKDEAERKRTIENLDISGNAAIAKIVLDYPTIKFVDYMSLLKIDGEWKIVNKSFYAEPKQPKQK